MKYFCLLLFVATTLAGSSGAQTYRILHEFQGTPDGAQSYGAMITDGAGNLYGTTAYGGQPAGGGSVFKITRTGEETILYSFSRGVDGGNPYGRLWRDQAGNLYGTTVAGGSSSVGVVFKVDTTNTETVLYTFQNMRDGAYPKAGVIVDSEGNLYGTTSEGGIACQQSQDGCGTVFKITPAGQETVLYRFTGGSDGGLPTGDLYRDAAGNLYGTTSAGGPYLCQSGGCGVVFKIDTAGSFSVFYAFQGSPDGAFPAAGLIRDGAGNFYGTTSNGGTNGGWGTVFELTSAGQEKILYSFGCCFGEPLSTPARDAAGNLYGTTVFGGANGWGAVFKIDPSGNETVLHNFNLFGGAEPWGGLVAVGGRLYGTTFEGGSTTFGVVYQISP